MKPSDLRFINSYHKKPKYSEETITTANEHDVVKRQAPLKTFQKVNKEKKTNYKYSFKKHLDRLHQTLPSDKIRNLIPQIDEVNAYAYANPIN